jgi:hydrogenase/urease accessory protein HupE
MNSRKAVRLVVLALAALGAGMAFAHPNHSEPGSTTTFLHLLTEPDHLLALLAALAVGLGAFGGLRHRAERTGRRD